MKAGLLSLVALCIWLPGVMGHAGDDPGRLVAALDSALTSGDTEALDSLLASDFRQHGDTDEIFPRPITRELYIEQAEQASRVLAGFTRRSTILAAGPDLMALEVVESGRHEGPVLGQAPSGHTLAIRALEVWRLGDDGRFAELWRQTDDIATLRQITAWAPDAELGQDLWMAREILHFPPGVFLESIIADEAGNLYFTKLMTGKVMKLAPDGTLTVFAELPVGGTPGVAEGIMCLVMDEHGIIFADAIAPGTPAHGIWRIDRDGEARHVAALPDAVFPNGITRDPSGVLYVADSGAGGVWRVDPEAGAATLWYDGELLQRRPYIGVFPPANGIQYWDGSLYVANSDRAHIVRIAIAGDGTPGPATVHATGVPGDDFAIDEDGVLYVTTHPYNSVIRVDRNGERTVIATLEQGVVGPAAAVFADRDGSGRKLYVVTDGGLYNPPPDRPLRPNVVELAPPGAAP